MDDESEQRDNFNVITEPKSSKRLGGERKMSSRPRRSRTSIRETLLSPRIDPIGLMSANIANIIVEPKRGSVRLSVHLDAGQLSQRRSSRRLSTKAEMRCELIARKELGRRRSSSVPNLELAPICTENALQDIHEGSKKWISDVTVEEQNGGQTQLDNQSASSSSSSEDLQPLPAPALTSERGG